MEDKKPQTEKEEPTVISAQDVKEEAKGLWSSFLEFMTTLLDIRDATDRDQTLEDIKKDIPFKGHTAWILIFSIFVASIGLNVSSTAVVIGAMLISPLMGPIVGVGISVAINDIDTLRKSFLNLGVMVGLSVFTAFLYFKLSPLTELTPELESRTAPTILDVFVAIFGGLALIVAKSKRGTMPNAIAGVAIATALMPPLCTVGYGLAIGEPTFYFGALYLFSINAIFIALATFVVSKLLRFPMIRYVNSVKRRRIARFASFIAILAVIPAIAIFIKVLNKSNVERDVRNFLEREINGNENLFLHKHMEDYTNKTIKLYFNGEVPDAVTSDLINELKQYEHIANYKLEVNGNKARGIDQVSRAYDRAIEEIERLELRNDELNRDVKNLRLFIAQKSQSGDNPIAFGRIAKDAKIEFEDLASVDYSIVLRSNFKKVDTLPTVRPVWKTKGTGALQKRRDSLLIAWFRTQMKVDTLVIQP